MLLFSRCIFILLYLLCSSQRGISGYCAQNYFYTEYYICRILYLTVTIRIEIETFPTYTVTSIALHQLS